MYSKPSRYSVESLRSVCRFLYACVCVHTEHKHVELTGSAVLRGNLDMVNTFWIPLILLRKLFGCSVGLSAAFLFVCDCVCVGGGGCYVSLSDIVSVSVRVSLSLSVCRL